jgi:hypothetical protein
VVSQNVQLSGAAAKVLNTGGNDVSQPVLDLIGSSTSVAPVATLKSIIIGPPVLKDPMVTVISSLLREQVIRLIPNPSAAPFRLVSLLDIDHSTPIPEYFDDSRLLIHLAFSLYPQFGDDALKKLALDYLEADEEEEDQMDVDMEIEENVEVDTEVENVVSKEDDVENVVPDEAFDDDVQVLDEASAIFMTPGRKKKSFKVRKELDDSFLRRNRRPSKKAYGFKDAKSAKEAKSAKQSIKKTSKKKAKKSAHVEEEPIPLAVIPPQGNAVAPHLPHEILQGIGEGFL